MILPILGLILSLVSFLIFKVIKMSENSPSLQVEIPPFSYQNLDLYFSTLNGIKAAFGLDNKQFFTRVFLTLPKEIQFRAQHLLYEENNTATEIPSEISPLPIDHLVKLREIIDAHFTLPIEDRIKMVVAGEKTLGNRKPSDYLRYIRETIGGAEVRKYEPLVKAAFLDALPENIATTVKIVAPDKNIDEIAVAADRVLPFNKSSTVAQVSIQSESNTADLEELKQKINALNIQKSTDFAQMTSQLQTQLLQMHEQQAQMDRMVEELKNSLETMRASYVEGSKSTASSMSMTHQEYAPRNFEGNRRLPASLCWYHARFGQEALRCSPGCKYFNQVRSNKWFSSGNAGGLR